MTFTADEARAAGTARARAGGTLFPTDPGIVASDELRRAWCEGYRAGQVHDPACSRCGGTGDASAGRAGTASGGAVAAGGTAILCPCNVGVDEDDDETE